MKISTKKLVERIFSQPTAPFCERFVLAEIESILDEHGIAHFRDSYGNLIAGAPNITAVRSRPRLILQAHTDHPGFHIKKRVARKRYQALWYGGAPFQHMANAPLRIYDLQNKGWSTQARLIRMIDKNYTREGVLFTLQLKEDLDLNSFCFGAFDFPGVQFREDRISTRAADDLSGCVIALGALLDQKKSRQSLAIFTRAEEVGFVGCWHLLSKNILHPNSLVLCLEASRALAMAKPGQGPVLRLGDRSTIFNSDFSVWMWQVAQELAKENSKFLFQRRLMDGGSCEATAFALHGFSSSGLAVPLVNYHNQGERGPKPEMIRLSDVDGARQLCAQLYAGFLRRPQNSKDLIRKLGQNARKLKPLLQTRGVSSLV